HLFVADSGNNAVKEILPGGTVQTLGSGFNNPAGVAVDPVGDVFVADLGNFRVVELSPPTVAATPSPLSGSQATPVSATLTGRAPGPPSSTRVAAAGPGGPAAAPARAFVTASASGVGLPGPAVAPTPLAVFEFGTATWKLRYSAGPGAPDVAPFAYGSPTSTPVWGDWDGDGSFSVGVVEVVPNPYLPGGPN